MNTEYTKSTQRKCLTSFMKEPLVTLGYEELKRHANKRNSERENQIHNLINPCLQMVVM
jgi:hypothetical protein